MSPSQPIRSLAAIVFTDIVGYSALVHRDDANAMRLVEEHFRLVREIAGRSGGKVIKTIGDSVHLEFASAQAATTCAIAVQQRHHQRNAQVAEAQRFDIRIGVHTGDVEHRGGDIYGDGVNIAARLQPLAPVGGIAISEHVRGQLREELRARFVSQGTKALKNIGTPVEVFTVEAGAIADIPVEVPTAAPRASGPRLPGRRIAFIGLGVAVLAGVVVLAAMLLRSPGAAAMDKSIAILPFVDMSQSKDQEYFSDGVAEDVLNLLSKVPQLKVIARTSSFSYKGKDTPIAEIARVLEVASVLQGSVRKSGDQVRITVQLIRAQDSSQLWSETYDRKVDDIFAIQDEIASAVVGQLRVQLLGELPTAKPVDPKAYPLILQADALLAQSSRASRAQSVETFQQALAIAPNEARAWAGLGRVYFNQVILGERPVEEGARLVKEAANKALELDPTNVNALAQLARVAVDIELDPPTAARHLQRALELEPGNIFVLNSAAAMLIYMPSRQDESLLLMEYRVAHDAANPSAFHNLGYCQYLRRQWDASIEASRTAVRLGPDITTTRAQIATSMLVGRHDAAGALRELEAEPDEGARFAGLPMVLHALGRTKEADAALQTLIEKYGKDQPVYVATAVVYRGDVNAGFEWLDKAVAVRDPGLPGVAVDPVFDRLHDDPRWLPLLRKLGSAPEQVAKIELKVNLPRQAGP